MERRPVTEAVQPIPTLPVLIFDGDCAFCTRAAGWLERRVAADVSVLPWQRTDLAALGATPERAQTEVLWAEPGARRSVNIRGGASAVSAALQHSRARLWRLAGHALARPPLSWLAPPVYRLIARNRHRLPGGTPACAVTPPAKPS